MQGLGACGEEDVPRRGGAAAAVYVAPDRGLVEQAIQATLVALVGTSSQARVGLLADLFVGEHRRSFDSRKAVQIDPMDSVMERIRGFAEYKSIHALRPESMNEMTWVSDRRGALLRAGVTPQAAEELAIEQATVGATEAEAARAGEVATFAGTRQVLPGFFRSMQSAATAAARLL